MTNTSLYRIIESSRTLDATIGLLVLGKSFPKEKGSGVDYDKVPAYSTNGSDALEIIDRLKNVPLNLSINYSKNIGWEVRCTYPDGKKDPDVTYNKSLPLALCVSAIKVFNINYDYIEKNTVQEEE